MVASTVGSARIQPMRSPPQNDFDIDPMVSTRSGRVTTAAASGAGGGPSRATMSIDRLVDHGAGPVSEMM